MITRFGMSEQLGLATYEDLPNPLFTAPGLTPRARKEYCESTAQIIDAEVRKILGNASQRVKQTLLANRHKLDALAKLLLEQEVVDRAALELLLSEKVTPLASGKTHPATHNASDTRKGNHENESK